MKLKQSIAILLTLALMLIGSSAFAVAVNLSGQPLVVAAVNIVDGSPVELTLQDFQLLGTNDNGDYLLYVDQNYYSASPINLGGVLSQFSTEAIAALPSFSSFAVLSYGSKGAGVERLQSALKTLGYLDGSVDGDFGRGTERAVVAFQAAIDAPQSGVAIPLQQMLAISMANPAQPGQTATGSDQTGNLTGTVMQLLGNVAQATDTQAQPVEAQPLPDQAQPVSYEVQYAAIIDRVTVNLQPVYDAGLTFDYDDMVGTGFISDGTVLSYDLSEGTDIGRYQVSVQFGLLTQDNEDGTVSVDPAVKLSCVCVHRPIMTDLILKSDTKRGTAPIEGLTSTLSGISSVESGYAILDDQMVAALADSVETGDLKLRINGRYHSFDIQVEDAYIPSASRIGVLAQQIKG